MRAINAAERIAARYIPKNALPVTEDETLGTVYVYPIPNGKYGALAFLPTAMKADWHYSFKTDARLDEHISKWFEGLRNHRDYVAKNREERKKPHTFKIGDIVSNSWGYDQTNVDWYRVTKTSAHFVWLEQIAGATTPDEGCGPMSGMCEPAIDTTSDDPNQWGTVATERSGVILNKSRKHAAAGSVITMRHGCGTKWDGKPKYESWYA